MKIKIKFQIKVLYKKEKYKIVYESGNCHNYKWFCTEYKLKKENKKIGYQPVTKFLYSLTFNKIRLDQHYSFVYACICMMIVKVLWFGCASSFHERC